MKKLTLTFLMTALALASASVMAGEYVVAQKDKTFVMDGSMVEELSISVGDTIRFENQDVFFHNIFSLSDLETFDLGSFPKGESRTVTFDNAGMVEVECAIHPEMYMEVTIE